LVLMPLDAEVESDVTLLLVDDSPVDIEPTPLRAVLMPLDADVESDPKLLLVDERPVDSDPT
jgi:hypothetical protein